MARRQAALASAGPVDGEEGGPVVSVDGGVEDPRPAWRAAVASGGGQLWRRVEAAVSGASDGRWRATGRWQWRRVAVTASGGGQKWRR